MTHRRLHGGGAVDHHDPEADEGDGDRGQHRVHAADLLAGARIFRKNSAEQAHGRHSAPQSTRAPPGAKFFKHIRLDVSEREEEHPSNTLGG